MSLEEQIKAYKKLTAEIDKLEEEKKVLSEAILMQMREKKVCFDDFTAHRYERFSIKLTLDEARQYQATKQEEVIDKEKIKALYQSGEPLTGVSKVPYLMITTKKIKK